MEQLTLDFEEKTTFNIGDRFQVLLPNPEKDSERYYYLKYYYPNLINLTGEILEKETIKIGIIIYRIMIAGNTLTLSEDELKSII